MAKETKMEERRKIIAELKTFVIKNRKPEDSIFNYHPTQDHIILSHTLFWVMSKPLANLLPHNQCFLLLRQYQEEMLEAYLTEDGSFDELLDFCNTIYDCFPSVINTYKQMSGKDRLHHKLAAIAIIASGVGGDMDTDTAYDLLDDIDFNRYGKVHCPAIEHMLPRLNKMVENEISSYL